MSNSGNDSIKKTIFVSLALCLICSVLVSGAAVYLKPVQNANKALDMKKNILIASGLFKDDKTIDELFNTIKPVVVDLESGQLVTNINPATFNQYERFKDQSLIHPIPKNDDIAGIKVRSKYSLVYLVMDAGELSQIILPVHGKGLWSTMYGFLALEKDTTTVKGFAFYSHGETPGLGGEVDNPNWKSLWKGKRVFSDSWEPAITILKGKVDVNSAHAVNQIDGLSGATLTSRGVHNLLRYWIGSDGFAKFLDNVRSGGVQI